MLTHFFEGVKKKQSGESLSSGPEYVSKLRVRTGALRSRFTVEAFELTNTARQLANELHDMGCRSLFFLGPRRSASR